MSPTLDNGDYVIIKKPRAFRPGLIYVVNHIDFGRIIKRLERIETDGSLIFSGDNAASASSAIIAPVAPERVIGRALIAITKAGLKRL